MFYPPRNGNNRTPKQRETIRVFSPSPTKHQGTTELERRIANITPERDELNNNIQNIYAAFALNEEKMPPEIEALLRKCKQPALLLILDARGNVKSELPLHLPTFIQPIQSIINDLNRLLIRANSEYPKLKLTSYIESIIYVYTSYFYDWERVDNSKRRTFLIPTPELCCEGGGYYRPPLDLSLQFLSRNTFGDRRKENEFGNRPVFAGKGVHFKAQPGGRDFITPGREQLASTTYNYYYPGLATSSLLLKLTLPKLAIIKEHQVTDLNKQYYEIFLAAQKKCPDTETLLTQRPDIAKNIVISYVPFNDCLQASLTIDGILFLDILQVKATLASLNKRLTPARTVQLMETVLKKSEQLKSIILPQDYTLDTVKKEFEDFFNTLPDDQKPIDCSKAGFERTFNIHRSDGVKKLHDTLQLLKSEGMSALMPGLKLADLIQLTKQLSLLSKLWPRCTLAERLARLDNFFSYWNAENAHQQFIANLELFPVDWKADNIMVVWSTDEMGNLKEWRIVGIDNDGVLPRRTVKRLTNPDKSPYHSVDVKCIPFCIPELLSQEILPSTRAFLVKQTPAEALITRIKAVYEQNFRYKRMTRTGVLVDDDLNEKDETENCTQQKLDVPVTLNLQAMLALYDRMQKLYAAGQSPSRLTLADVFTIVDPIVAGVHQLAIRTTSNPIDAFLKASSTNLENTFGKDIDQGNLRAQLQALSLPKQDQQLKINEDFSPEDLIVVLVHHFANQPPAVPGQLPPVFEILSAVATIFSMVPLDLKLPKATLNKWLLLAAQHRDRLDPILMMYLIEQGADPAVCDEAKRTVLHIVLKEWSAGNCQEQLLTELIAAGIKLDVNAVDSERLPALFYLIDWAHKDINKATRLLQLLLQMDIDLDAVDPKTHESALDKAIKRNKPETFIMLVEVGAGRQVDARKASDFIRKYQNDSRWKIPFQNALKKLDLQNPGVAFITDIENYTQTTPPTPQEIEAAFVHEKKRQQERQLAREKEELERQRANGASHGPSNSNGKPKSKEKPREVLPLPKDYPYLIVGALSDKRYLKPEAAIQLYNKMAAKKVKSDSEYGNATAFCVELNGRKLWFKCFPELAGTEESNNVLSQMLKYHCVIPSELFRFLDLNGKPFSMLISQDAQGENIQKLLKYNPARAKLIFENLDPESAAELIVFLMLIGPDDAKWDNLIAVEFKNSKNETKFKLKLIDTDRSMVKQGSREKDKRTKVKAAAFCLEFMRQSLPKSTRIALIKHIPAQLITNWMEQLTQRKLRYADLFTLSDRKSLLSSSSKHRPSIIPILIPPRALIEFYQRLVRIQCAIQVAPNQSLLELLNLSDPRTGQRYTEAFNIAPIQTPEGRFDYLAKELYGKSKKGYYTTLLNSEQFSQTLGIPKEVMSGETNGYGPDDALREFQLALNEEQYIARVQMEFEKGNVDSLLALTLDTTREQVIARTDFSRVPPELQRTLLKTISTEIAFSRLVLIGCSVLTDQLLSDFFEHSPFLQHFELHRTQGSKITDACLVRLSERCRHLQTLIIVDVATLKLPHDGNAQRQKPLIFPELRRFTVRQLPLLSSTLLDVPVLQVLEVEHCPAWQNVSVSSRKITTLRIKSCPAIPVAQLEPILSANSLEVMDLSHSPQLSHQQLLRGQLEKEKCSKGLVDPLIHGDRLDLSGYFMTVPAIKTIANIFPDLTTVSMTGVNGDALRLSVAIMTFMQKTIKIDHPSAYLERRLLLRQFRFEVYQQANVITCRLLTPPNQSPLPVDRFKTTVEGLLPDMRVTQTTDFSKAPVLHFIINDENLRFSLFLFLLTARPIKVEIDRFPDNLTTLDIELFVKFNPKVTMLDIRNRKNVDTSEATVMLSALPELDRLLIGGDFSSYNTDFTCCNSYGYTGTITDTMQSYTRNDFNGNLLPLSENKFLLMSRGIGVLVICDTDFSIYHKRLEGHTQQVTSTLRLPDGSLFTSSEDKTIRKWDLSSYRCLFILQARILGKQQLIYHPSGRMIGLDNGTILKVWDANTGQCLHTLRTSHTQWIKSSLHLLKDGTVLSACCDKLEVWNINSGQRLKSIECKHTNFPVVVLPDERVARALIFYDQLGTHQDKKLGSITLEIDDLHSGLSQRYADIAFDYLQSVVDKGETLEKYCTLTLLPNGKLLFARIPSIPNANNLKHTPPKDMYLLFSTANDSNNRDPLIINTSTLPGTNPYPLVSMPHSDIIICSKPDSIYSFNLTTNSFEKRLVSCDKFTSEDLLKNEYIYTNRSCVLVSGEIVNLGYDLQDHEAGKVTYNLDNQYRALKPAVKAIALSLDTVARKLTAKTAIMLSMDRITIDDLDNPDTNFVKLLAQIFNCAETNFKITENKLEIQTDDQKKQTQINNFIQTLLNRAVFQKGSSDSYWDDERSDYSSYHQQSDRSTTLPNPLSSNNASQYHVSATPTLDNQASSFRP